MKSITVLFIGMALLGCSNNTPSKTIPSKKTFVKKENNTAPSNRNGYYPPVGLGGYYNSNVGYQGVPNRHYQRNNGSMYNGGEYYVEPLGNGPLTYQNSAEDIENQRQGRD